MQPRAWWGYGGSHLASAGVRLVDRLERFGTNGLVEALGRLPRNAVLLARVIEAVERRPPSLGVLVDYPDFRRIIGKLSIRSEPKHTFHTLQVSCSIRVIGICFDSPFEQFHSCLKVAALREKHSEIVASIGIFGLQFKCLLVCTPGTIRIAKVRKHQAQMVVEI